MKTKPNRKSLALRLRAVRKILADLDVALYSLIQDLEDSGIEILDTRGSNGSTAAQRIKKTRIERGLNQTQLALLAGMRASQLCKIEHGSSDVTAKTAKRLSHALGVSLSWLLCGQ